MASAATRVTAPAVAPVAVPGGGSFRPARRPRNESDGVLRPGSHVRHATLGKGVVLQLDGDGEDAKLTVFFDKAGKRKLIRRYAPLEVL